MKTVKYEILDLNKNSKVIGTVELPDSPIPANWSGKDIQIADRSSRESAISRYCSIHGYRINLDARKA